ncbi:MAG: hypothetical protein Q8O40_13345 [Chloroflexota bacterium]|nr:hypothetical protein [Chloroflexota bacterium]
MPKNGGVVTETDDGLVTPIVPIGTWRESYFRALLRHLPCTNGDHGAMRAQIAVLTADERRQRNELIFDLWLAGHTEPQIAHKVELSLAHVHRIIDILRQAKAGGTENIEKLPIYNVWNYPKCDPRFGLGYPGRPPRGAPAQGLEAPTPGVD